MQQCVDDSSNEFDKLKCKSAELDDQKKAKKEEIEEVEKSISALQNLFNNIRAREVEISEQESKSQEQLAAK